MESFLLNDLLDSDDENSMKLATIIKDALHGKAPIKDEGHTAIKWLQNKIKEEVKKDEL